MRPLALSLGDPSGIGPELVAEAWARRADHSLPPFFVAGGARLLAAAMVSRSLHFPVIPIASPEEAVDAFDRGLPVLGMIDGAFRPGDPCAAGAGIARASLEQAVSLALSQEASAVVTSPVAKDRLARVGFDHPGQTEYLADRCGMEPGEAVMMLAGPNLRTVPVTVHCALAEVPQRLTTPSIMHRVRVTAHALVRDFGIEAPRLAVAGLNPHAGEGGRFGTQEVEIIGPAIDALRSEGLAVTGPHPPDALFTPRARGNYDAAICMYHDQALIPLKALDFDEGVNVTLGLPIVRTSADHGTAFDIAGQNLADPGATIAAIRMAGEIARNRAGG